MNGDSTEDLTVYPYFVDIYRHKITAELLSDRFHFDNVLENAYPKPIDSGRWPKDSIICDGREDNLIYGRFLKLRKDAIEFLQSKGTKLSERLQFPELGEYLEENSHFLWDVEKGVIFCEYNHKGMRRLQRAAEKLVSNILGFRGSDDLKIGLVPTDELLENLANGGTFNRAVINLPDISKSHLEKMGFKSDIIFDIIQHGFSMKMDLISKIAEPRDVDTIDKVIRLRNELKKIRAKNFKLYTDEGVVDLIDANYLYYVITVDLPDQDDFSSSEDGQKELRERMHSIIWELYNKHIDGLLKMRPNQSKITEF